MVDATSTIAFVRGISLERDAGDGSKAEQRQNELEELVCEVLYSYCRMRHTSIPAQMSLYLGLSGDDIWSQYGFILCS